jgi:lysyl-tRNA synthetase class 2
VDIDPADFRPTAALSVLAKRHALLKRLRLFFDDRGFVEVDTPLLSRDSVVDLNIDPLKVTLFSDPTQPDVGQTLWLQTSPEFAMKRLLAAGAERIYQITHAFRGGEQGDRHNPEFTMVEWYRVGDGLREGMELLGDLTREMLSVPAVDLCTYRDAFVRHAGVDPHRASIGDLRHAALARGIDVPRSMADSSRDGWLNLLLAEFVEPQLGTQRPLILFDYPASQAALARVREDDPPVAERFELYYRGVELANGYHELLDSQMLEKRNREANDQRVACGKYRLPEESRLLDAMRHGLPRCAGVALGFDRLLMAVVGAQHIHEVMPFPIDRA